MTKTRTIVLAGAGCALIFAATIGFLDIGSSSAGADSAAQATSPDPTARPILAAQLAHELAGRYGTPSGPVTVVETTYFDAMRVVFDRPEYGEADNTTDTTNLDAYAVTMAGDFDMPQSPLEAREGLAPTQVHTLTFLFNADTGAQLGVTMTSHPDVGQLGPTISVAATDASKPLVLAGPGEHTP